jgi:hypothetical protein
MVTNEKLSLDTPRSQVLPVEDTTLLNVQSVNSLQCVNSIIDVSTGLKPS